MKKYLIAVALALVSGTLFAYYILSDNDKLTKVDVAMEEQSTVSVFQVGVFQNEDNANNFKNNFKSSKVVYEEDYYRVYTAVYTDAILINNLENYYIDNNITYVIKEKLISSNLYNEINDYEKLLKETEELEVVFNTNNIILDTFFK